VARPKEGYRLKDGTRVVGVTTVIGGCKLGGIEGLLVWANRLGQDGKSHREERDRAAEVGTVVHDLIEADALDRSPPVIPDEFREQVETGYGAYLDWKRHTRLELVETETSMVSEQHRFGGTLDAIGYCDGRLSVLDWKCSGAIYPDYIIQLAAYRELWRETRPDDAIEGFHLLRVGKEYGDFHHHSFPPALIDEGWNAFLHMRRLYDIHARLKKATR